MNRVSAARAITIWSPLALVVMVGCVSYQVVDGLNAELFTGRGLNGAYLVFACMLAVIAGWYLACSRIASIRIRWPFRLVEYSGIAFFLLSPWVGPDLGSLVVLVKLGIWTLLGYGMILLARNTSRLILMDILAIHLSSQEAQDAAPVSHNALNAIRARVIWGLALMLAVIAFAVLWSRLSKMGVTINLPASFILVLSYSITSLVMLGQLQFSILRKTWNSAGALISPDLAPHWLRANLLLIFLVAAFAFALPSPLPVIPKFPPDKVYVPTTPTPDVILALNMDATSTPSPKPTEERTDKKSNDSFTKFVGSIWKAISGLLALVIDNTPTVFIIITIGISIYLVWNRVKRRKFVHASPGAAGSQQRDFSLAASGNLEDAVISRALSSRNKVFGYYMSMLRRARETGLERQPGQTPNEFAARLISEMPDSSEDLSQLTQAFIEARYSPQDPQEEQVEKAHSLWQRIRASFKAHKK